MAARRVIAVGLLAAAFVVAAGPSHWNFGPFFEYDTDVRPEGRDGVSLLAVRPFYSQVHDAPADASAHDVLWPIGFHRRAALDNRWFFLPAYGFYSDPQPAFTDGPAPARRHASSFNVFPLWFSGYDRDDASSYWAAFPLYGRHPHFLTMDDLTFVLWPFYLDYEVDHVRSHAVCWPFVSWKDEPRAALGIWPFYGAYRQRESDHRYALWPLATWAAYDEDRDRSGAGSSWMFWPLAGAVARTRETQYLFLPPFFSYAETPERRRWRAPWPLVDVELGRVRDRVSVWPLWEQVAGYAYADAANADAAPEERTWRAGWKLIESTTLETARTRERRFSFFPFFTCESTTEGGVEKRSYLRIWPFYSRETEGAHVRRRALDLVPVRRADGLERNWAPFWTLWSTETRPDGRTHHSLLWHFITWHDE